MILSRSRIILFAIIVSACGDDLPPDATLHPVKEYMPFASTAIANHESEIDDSLSNAIRTLLQYDYQVSIGAIDYDEYTKYIGTIDDIELSDNRLVYLLDAANSNVKVYDDQGVLLSVIGTSGEGPGEFRAPKGIHIDVDGRILLIDGGKHSQILVPSPEAKGQYESSVVEAFVTDAVFANDHSIVALAGFQTDSLLVKIMPHEEIESAKYYGHKYKSSNRVVNWNMSEGVIVPHSDGGFFIVFRKMPLVVRYDKEFQVAWSTLLPNYSALKTYGFVNRDGNDVSRVDKKGVTDMLQDAVMLPGDVLLVQIARVEADYSMSILPTEFELRNYVIDDDGHVRQIESNLVVDDKGRPLSIMDWADDSYVVGISYPAPKAFLRHR